MNATTTNAVEANARHELEELRNKVRQLADYAQRQDMRALADAVARPAADMVWAQHMVRAEVNSDYAALLYRLLH